VTESVLLWTNLGLDILLKALVIGFLVYLFYVLRRLSHAIEKAEESIDSVEEAADEAARLVRIGRKIPLLGGPK